jgi:hypothetical protein
VAAISVAKIGNLALSNVGTRSTIEIIDEASPEAKQVKLWYDFSREQALKVYDWSFARKRLILALHGVAPPDEYSFRYQYPVDCLVIRKLINPYGRDLDAIHYTIESATDAGATTKSVLTDLAQATVVYTADVQDPTLFSPFFVELLATLLGHHIAFALTGDRRVKGDLFTLYRGMVDAAPMHDANEAVAESPRDAEWVRARGYGIRIQGE